MKIKIMVILFVIATASCNQFPVENSKNKVFVLGYAEEGRSDGLAFLENINNFKEANPDITVEWVMEYDEDYHRTLHSYLRDEKQLDVLYMWNGGGRLISLVEANEDIDQLQFIDKSKFDSPALAANPMTGDLNAVPISRGAHTIFYSNDDLLDELGLGIATTYEELLKQKSIAESNNKIILSYPGKTLWCNNSFLYSILMARFGGAEFVDRVIAKKAKFTDEPSLNSYKFIERMYNDGILNEVTLAADYGVSLAMFNSNEALYFIDGGWRAAQIRVQNYSYNKFPSLPGEVVSGSGNGGYSAGYAITKSAANGPQREASIKLLNYLLGEEASMVRAKLTGAVPAFKVQGNIEYRKETERGSKYIESLTEISKTVGDYIDKDTNNINCEGIFDLGNGLVSPEQLAKEVQEEYEK